MNEAQSRQPRRRLPGVQTTVAVLVVAMILLLVLYVIMSVMGWWPSTVS